MRAAKLPNLNGLYGGKPCNTTDGKELTKYAAEEYNPKKWYGTYEDIVKEGHCDLKLCSLDRHEPKPGQPETNGSEPGCKKDGGCMLSLSHFHFHTFTFTLSVSLFHTFTFILFTFTHSISLSYFNTFTFMLSLSHIYSHSFTFTPSLSHFQTAACSASTRRKLFSTSSLQVLNCCSHC